MHYIKAILNTHNNPLTLKIIGDFLTPLAYDIESPGYDEKDEEAIVNTDYSDVNQAMGGRLYE